jgi:pantoate--beta-alanine ligase
MRVKQLVESGERDVERLKSAGREEIGRESAMRLDYFEIVDPESLDPVSDVGKGVLVAVAAYVGRTRLIDNLVL